MEWGRLGLWLWVLSLFGRYWWWSSRRLSGYFLTPPVVGIGKYFLSVEGVSHHSGTLWVYFGWDFVVLGRRSDWSCDGHFRLLCPSLFDTYTDSICVDCIWNSLHLKTVLSTREILFTAEMAIKLSSGLYGQTSCIALWLDLLRLHDDENKELMN